MQLTRQRITPPTGSRSSSLAPRLLALARAALLLVLCLAPLAFGAVQPWAWGILIVAVCGVGVLWTLGCLSAASVAVVLSPLHLPLFLIAMTGMLQLLTGSTADCIGTREALIKLAISGLVFFLVQQLWAKAGDGSWLVMAWSVTGYMLAMAVFAIAQSLVTAESLYGLIRPRWASAMMGPYVNHNHYAGLMEMLIALSLGFAVSQSFRIRSLLWVSVLVAVLSVIVSGSRGGVIAVGLEMALVLCMSAFTKRAKRQRQIVLATAALSLGALALLVWMDPGGVWKRWQIAMHSPETALDLRVRTTPDALRMFCTHLWKGVGLGAFEAAYPRYQTLVSDRVVDYAHNDYAQLAAETGIAGSMIAAASVASFLWLSFRRLQTRLRTPQGCVQLGAAVGVCGLLVHSFSDFNLHIPANSAWFAACAAWATLPSAPDDGSV